MSTRYILIADASRARLFHEQPNHGFELVDTYDHPESRALTRHLISEAKAHKPAGPHDGRPLSPGIDRRGATPDTDEKEVEAQKFARSLALMLEKTLTSADARLVLAAPPHFLGILKDTLSDEVSKHLELAVDKDFTKISEHDIHARMRKEWLPS